MKPAPIVPALRVGVSALFDPGDTPHARTFLRALCVARNSLPHLQQVQWRFLDDGAHAGRGATVARQFVDWRADVVIGHFSSDAAMGAAQVYQRAGIALLTPAATLDDLTLQHANVFRFCPSDRQLAADLVAWLHGREWRVVHVSADDSAHGQGLARAIVRAAGRQGLRVVPQPEQAQVEVFAGRLRASRQHWHARRAAGSKTPLVLTDDAASVYLGAAQDRDPDSYVIGFGGADRSGESGAAQLRTLFNAVPETYHRESLLMLHVVAQLAVGPWRNRELLPALQTTRFDTPLGEVAFSEGELQGVRTGLWRIGPAGLTPLSG